MSFGTIRDAIARHADAAGESSLALVGCGSRSVTFKQLRASIASVGDDLAAAGLGPGDRVGLLVPPGVSGAQLVVALASNVTLVPVNPSLTPHEIADSAKVAGLSALVIPRSLDTPARSIMLEQEIAVLDAVAAPDGTPRLQALGPGRSAAAPRRAASDTDAALLLRSSGTTGAPKLVPVTHRNLVAMSRKLATERWFHVTARDRVPCTLQLYYAAGLKTSLLVPLILGASVGFPPDGRTLDVAEWIDELKPTYLSVVPGTLIAILDRLKQSAHDQQANSLRFIMCGAAYLPEHVRLAAESMLRVPVLEFYALSEAGIMAANPAPPERRKPGTVGLPAEGELRLVEENGEPAAQGAVGQIAVSGPSVTPGYVTSEGSAADRIDGWLLTGDLGRLDEDGYLSIVGRVKEVINRGGEKVFPYEIEKALLRHPAVADAAAFGVPHPRLGEGVAAAVVLKEDARPTEQDLREFLAQRLATFKLPRSIRFLASLPRGSTGKVSRRALSEAYAAPRSDLAEPYYLLEFELRDIWRRLLGTASFGIDDDFFEIGGDSLLATEMLLEVERLTGRPYPQSDLSSLTIRRICTVVTSGLARGDGLVTPVKSGGGIPLFFCHGDYLTRGIYAHKLAALLPANQPVFLLHCPVDRARGSSIEQVASAYLEEVLRAAPRSPVFVGGYCNGGLVAWHLAHLLRSRGVDVVGLLLVETLSLNARPGMRALARMLAAAARVAPKRAGSYLRHRAMRLVWIWRRRLARLAAFEYGANVLLFARRRAPDILDQALLASMAQYLPKPLDVEVSCLLAEHGRNFDTKSRFWRTLASEVQEVRVPGTHHTAVVSERQALATALSRAMNQASARYRARAAESAGPGVPVPADPWIISAKRGRI